MSNKLISPREMVINSEYGLSNFDHTSELGTEEFLRKNPSTQAVCYYGWDFCAYVAFDKDFELFVIDVLRFGSLVETMTTPNFEDIIELVSDKYGWD